MRPEVDIVILNHNGKRFLDECLTTVLASTYPKKQVYLLDNASTDDDVAYVREKYPDVKIIQNPNNNGYCAAYNLAFDVCPGEYIVCLNNDVSVDAGWLEPMVNLAESDQRIGAIQPKVLAYHQPTHFEYAGGSGGMIDVYGYPFLRGRIFTHIEEDKGQYDDIVPIFWASGATMFVRKSALEDSGNLDETIVHHMDEIDLCWRLRLAGYTIYVQPEATIKHIGGGTITTKSFAKIYWNHRNSLYMMLKNYSFKNVIKYVTVHVLLDYVVMLKSLLTFDFTTLRAVASAHIWLIANTGLIVKKRKEVQLKRKMSDSRITPYMYHGSIVFAFFIRKINTFSKIKKFKKDENKPNTSSLEWANGASAGDI
ncbi:MAG: glycosyltransferase family 2 protein [Bacteroidia bacterium]|nr:glycosyltransferase family 2 protein [Bacteroidia bacterium]